jgi:hypothetical protein
VDSGATGGQLHSMPQKLRFAMVCASNQNRSMEAHRVLKENNFNVSCKTLLVCSKTDRCLQEPDQQQQH